jgi:hypothetical protein
MNPDPKFQAGIHQEIAWKNGEMQRFAVELVSRALASGRPHFTADLVPSEARGDGKGIAGSVIELHKNAGVVRPDGNNSNGQWFALRAKSTRKERNGAWLSVYQLTSAAIAEAFLKRHGG